MSSPVLYRKWRPQTLGQVVGQEHVTRTLLNALAAGRVSHAYLFCGPRGTGKTSTARILAKAVNCTAGGGGDPCTVCEMCTAIAEGRALDLVEIDAASNTGVDDIREVREKVSFAPAQGRFKVYVVDEVHMLSTSAFNALLKTLEEPPPHVIFVLATTEVHRVPPTILSRCQRFDFRRISTGDLSAYLARICEAEGISYEGEALDLVARCAHGSARDAVNLLEQAEVAGNQVVELAAVEDLLGLRADPRALQLVRAIAAGDLKQGLNTIQEVRESGANLVQFGKEVGAYLRAVLLLKAGSDDAVELAAEQRADLRTIAPTFPLEVAVAAVRAYSQLEFRGDSGSSLPLELALLDTIAPAPAAMGVTAPAAAARPVAQRAPSPAPAGRPAAERPQAPHPETPRPVAAPTPAAAATTAAPDPPAVPRHFTPGDLDQFREVLKGVRVPEQRFLETVLRGGCTVERIDGDQVTLGFRPSFSSHKERLEKPENLRLVEAAVKKITGVGYRIRCEIVNGAPSDRPAETKGHLVRAAIEAGARQVP